MSKKYVDAAGLNAIISGYKVKLNEALALKQDKTATVAMAGKLSPGASINGALFDGTKAIDVPLDTASMYSKDQVNTKLAQKVDTVAGKGLVSIDYSNTYKNKLAAIEVNANNYTHPAKHPGSMIEETASKKWTTDIEKEGFRDSYTQLEADTKVDDK